MSQGIQHSLLACCIAPQDIHLDQALKYTDHLGYKYLADICPDLHNIALGMGVGGNDKALQGKLQDTRP